MSFSSWMRPRTLLRSATALVAGAAVWVALGAGNVGAATAAAAALPTSHVNLPMMTKDGAVSISSNWAGYAVTGSATAPTEFTRVFAAWVQPEATCVPGQATYSAFWVGLGGYDPASQALEQTGTEVDCSVTGKASYSAWYELVPAPPVTVKLAISPGDSIVASVSVSGRNVTVKLTNYTTKKTFAKKLSMSSPDVSSAEWIAEAPSACTRRGVCTPLPLTDFGTVTFVSASATAVLLHTGAITGPAWTAIAIALDGVGGVGGTESSPYVAAGANAVATPTALSSDGSSFGVSWSPPAATTAPVGPISPGP